MSTLIRVAPGLYVDPTQMPSFPKSAVLLNKKGMEHIGLNESQHKTIRRLAEAGFIKVMFIAPRVWLLDLESWNQHVARVSEDPWFWDPEGKHLARYRGTYRVRRRA